MLQLHAFFWGAFRKSAATLGAWQLFWMAALLEGREPHGVAQPQHGGIK